MINHKLLGTPLGIWILVSLLAGCASSPATTDAMGRGRQLTEWFQAGNLDSLVSTVRAFDLAGPGDSVVGRWVLEPGGAVPSNWPEAVATLNGRDGMAQMIERARDLFGQESGLVEDDVYENNRFVGQSDYFRISNYSGYEDGTLTANWTIDRDGASPGGWLMPTPEVPPSEFEDYEPKTQLRPPFEGEWTVLQGGRKPHENDHLFHDAIRYACDFIVVREGLSFSGSGTKNSDHFAFGLPIVAPAPGRVVAVMDTFPENTPPHPRPDYRGPGNLVVIDHGNGEYSVLAHLKQGSVTVAPGDSVSVGQKLGDCGNNGFSTEPHLHYQLQLGPGPGAAVVPTVFHDYWTNGVHVERSEPRKGQRIRGK